MKNIYTLLLAACLPGIMLNVGHLFADEIGVLSLISGDDILQSQNSTYQLEDLSFSTLSRGDFDQHNLNISFLESETEAETAITRGPFSYPNPIRFNDQQSAHIGFALNKNSDITIKLFSISGRKIWQGNYPKGATGGSGSFYNKVEISPTTLGFQPPSGAYLFTIHDTETNRILGKESIGVQP